MFYLSLTNQEDFRGKATWLFEAVCIWIYDFSFNLWIPQYSSTSLPYETINSQSDGGSCVWNFGIAVKANK